MSSGMCVTHTEKDFSHCGENLLCTKKWGVLGGTDALSWVPLEKPAFVSQVAKDRKKGGL